MKRLATLCAALLLGLTSCAPQEVRPSPTATTTPESVSTPAVSPVAEVEILLDSELGEFDFSDLERGLFRARYHDTATRVKVQVVKEDGLAYNYDLHTSELFECFPLTEGDGTYTVRLLEQLDGTRYAVRECYTLRVALSDPFAPFLAPNQIVSYTADGAVAALAAQLTASQPDTSARIEILFDYVVDHISYAHDDLEALQSGYIPNVEEVLETGMATCYGYAALLCAMLRSVNIPCRLTVGDTHPDELYHAWVEVWSEEDGTVDACIPLAAGSWNRLDPTFVSNRSRTPAILDYVTDDSHYEGLYRY